MELDNKQVTDLFEFIGSTKRSFIDISDRFDKLERSMAETKEEFNKLVPDIEKVKTTQENCPIDTLSESVKTLTEALKTVENRFFKAGAIVSAVAFLVGLVSSKAGIAVLTFFSKHTGGG